MDVTFGRNHYTTIHHLTTPYFYNSNSNRISKLRSFSISLHVWHSGTYTEVARSTEVPSSGISVYVDDYVEKTYSVAKDVRLQAGDKIHVQWFFSENDGEQANFGPYQMLSPSHYFSGHLIFAE